MYKYMYVIKTDMIHVHVLEKDVFMYIYVPFKFQLSTIAVLTCIVCAERAVVLAFLFL